jgi:hypothetical protein
MTCEECGGARFEFAGVTEATTVRLRCTRCAHVVEQAVDDAARPSPVGGTTTRA